jgi:tetratricopeptide (TPR) repeat protein
VVPGLIIFAAALLDGLPAMIAEKKYPKLGSLALLTVALLVFISVDVTPADYVLDEANAHCRLAAVRLKEDRFDDALSAYEKALDISPTYWAAHLGVASAQERKGNLGAALESYEKAAKLAPGIPDPHVRAGHILFQMRELERSAAHYGEALKDDPRKPGLHRRLAVIHNILGNEEEAQAHIEKAAQLLAERASGP